MKPEVEFITEAIGVLCPNGGSWNGIEVTPVSDPVPTQKELDDKVAELKAEYTTQEYARNRAAEYPSIAELTVALYDDEDKAAIETKRAAIKAKYPKPS